MKNQQEYPFDLFKGGESKKVENSAQEAQARVQGFTEPYKFQEYPKHLYMGGVREVHPVSGDQVGRDEVVVRTPEEEDDAREKGYLTLGEGAEKVEPEKATKVAKTAKKSA